MSAEAKVGLLVIATALIALAVAIFLSDALRNIGAYSFTVQFANVQGLDTGSPVRYSGKRIGDVSAIELTDYPGKPVAVELTVKTDKVIYRDDSFEIKQGSLVGEKYVEITPADQIDPEKHRPVEPGDVIEGGGASSAEVVMDEARRLIVAAREAVDAANLVISDVETQENLKQTIANLEKATSQATVITQKAIEVVDVFGRASVENERRLAAIMQNLIASSRDIRETTKAVERMVSVSPVPAQMAAAGDNVRKASEDLAAISADVRRRVEGSTIDARVEEALAALQEASDNIRQMTADAQALTGDEQLHADIRATLENVRRASENLQATTEHAEKLLGDEQINEDLRAAVSNLRATTESSSEAIKQAQDVMTDLKATLDSVRETQEMFTRISARTRLQGRVASDDGVRTDMAVDLRFDPEDEHYWRLGVRDFGDAETVDAQITDRAGPGWLRAGIFGNKVGVGYDWEYGGPEGAIEAELYDPDDARLDLRWRLAVEKRYDLLLGMERAFKDNDPIIGLRYMEDF